MGLRIYCYYICQIIITEVNTDVEVWEKKVCAEIHKALNPPPSAAQPNDSAPTNVHLDATTQSVTSVTKAEGQDKDDDKEILLTVNRYRKFGTSSVFSSPSSSQEVDFSQAIDTCEDTSGYEDLAIPDAANEYLDKPSKEELLGDVVKQALLQSSRSFYSRDFEYKGQSASIDSQWSCLDLSNDPLGLNDSDSNLPANLVESSTEDLPANPVEMEADSLMTAEDMVKMATEE